MYHIRLECRKHLRRLECLACPSMFVLTLESCLELCVRSWFELGWRPAWSLCDTWSMYGRVMACCLELWSLFLWGAWLGLLEVEVLVSISLYSVYFPKEGTVSFIEKAWTSPCISPSQANRKRAVEICNAKSSTTGLRSNNSYYLFVMTPLFFLHCITRAAIREMMIQQRLGTTLWEVYHHETDIS